MSIATAFVLVGTPHPNDNGINPEWMIELWEGNVARWAARHLAGSGANLVSDAADPDDIGPALVRFISQLTSGRSDRFSVVVSPLENSSLKRQIHFLRNLHGCDLHVLTPTYSKTFSHWSGEEEESGRLQSGKLGE